LRVNEDIRAREVRLIDTDGQQIGIVPLREALEKAWEKGLDLVEVAPNANPKVCRIMDYGKFKYEQSKREREARKKHKTVEIKELQLRPKIEEHDFNVKVRNAQRFLKDGNKVKVRVMFRGREIVHQELALKLCQRLADAVSDLGVVEKKASMEGRNMIMILSPKGDRS